MDKTKRVVLITLLITDIILNKVFACTLYPQAHMYVTTTPIGTDFDTPPPVPFANQVAGTPVPIYLTYQEAQQCRIKDMKGTKNMSICVNYVNPSTGTLPIVINHNGTNYIVGVGCTTIPIIFKAGRAPDTSLGHTLTVTYYDVGSINISARDTQINNSMGYSTNFAVKPHHFDITGTGIPGTTSATGAVFTQDGTVIKAGTPFTAIVTAKSSINTTTPNYGNETPAENVKLVSQSVALPTGTGGCSGAPCNGSLNNGAVTNVTTPVKTGAGQFTGSFSFDEVGSFNVSGSVIDGNYLGAGDVVTTPTVVIGRFIPDHFDIVEATPAASFSAANTGGSIPFTYLEQPFVYSVQPTFTATAKSVSGTITKNYTGSLWKLNLTSGSQQYMAATGSPTLNSTSATATTPNCVSTGYGVGTCTFSSGSGLKFMKTTGMPLTLTAPFQAAIQLRVTVADTDTVPYLSNPFTFGTINPGTGMAFVSNGNTFYHGRLMIDNVQGSESSGLTVPVTAQYYNGTGFVTNTNDNSTDLVSVNNLTLTKTPTGSSSSFSSNASLPTPSKFSQGVGSILLSAPTPTNASGYVDIQANLGVAKANLPWLQFSWPYAGSVDGNYIDDPVGRATFGTTASKPPFIYQREGY